MPSRATGAGRPDLAARVSFTAHGGCDLEAVTVWPTLPLLLAPAETFDVPVTLLINRDATPLQVLRRLAGEYVTA